MLPSKNMSWLQITCKGLRKSMYQSMKIQGTRATQSKELLNEVVLRTYGTRGETF